MPAAAIAVLEACGRPVHLGPLGSGEVAKACNQLIASAAVLALGEAAVLADRSGLELATLIELFEGGYADSRILRTRGPRMVADDFRPSGMARYLLKDLDFASDPHRTPPCCRRCAPPSPTWSREVSATRT
jgi:2-hydroxy-3-oxopropionate reductase